MSDIFISYRRSESSDVTGRIFDELSRRLGKDRVFKDLHSILPGLEFPKVILKAAADCKVLLAVIGKDWLTVPGPDGKPRIKNRKDYVHIEIATALRRRIPVIPLLVQNASFPAAADLPHPLKGLAKRHGIPVRSGRDFDRDMDDLSAALKRHLAKSRARLKLTTDDVQCLPGKVSDVADILELLRKHFGDRIPRRALINAWLRKNSRVFWMVKRTRDGGDGPSLLGAFKMLPLNSRGVSQIKNGDATGSTLGADGLAGPKGKASGIYIGNVAALEGSEGHLMAFLRDKARSLTAAGDVPIYARALTSRGLRLLRRHRFVSMLPRGGEPTLGNMCVLDKPPPP